MSDSGPGSLRAPWAAARAAIADGPERIGPFRRFDGVERVRIVSESARDGLSVVVFLHTTDTETPEKSTSTIASFAAPDLDLAAFRLAPRVAPPGPLANALLDVVAFLLSWAKPFMRKSVAHPAVDFPERRDFTAAYEVTSLSESEVRRILRDEALAFFVAHPGWSVEAITGQMLMWREDVMEPPDRMPAFLDEATRIASLFRRR
jgi:hypothetical protein